MRLVLTALASFLAFSQLPAQAFQQQGGAIHIPGTDADVFVIRDGTVTCYVADGTSGGGLICKGEATNVQDLKTVKFDVGGKGFFGNRGVVVRKVIDGRLCYVYDGTEANDISCL